MLRNKTAKLASAAAIGLFAIPLFSGVANADVKAFSSLHVENFTISDAGGQLDFATDFDLILAGNRGLNSSTLTGFPGAAQGAGPTFGDVNALQACSGAGCAGIGENDFTQQAFPPTNSFARGDGRILGAAILNAPGASQSTVTADTVGETQINTSGSSGNGAGTVGTDTIFNFSLTSDRQLTFSFSARGVLETILGADAALGSVAGASFGFSITIRNAAGAVVFAWEPDGQAGGITGGTELLDEVDISQGASQLTPGTTAVDTGLGDFSAITNLLSASINYTLTIAHSSVVGATFIRRIPEPTSLALFSFGLLAAGLIAMPRRRKNGGMA